MVDGRLETAEKIKNFEDLRVWQDGFELSINIYKLTSNFPKSELFSMTNQMQRASYSIPVNIAEGFGRKNIKEKIQYYRIAYGSLLELKTFVYLSAKLNYMTNEKSKPLLKSIESIQRQINSICIKLDGMGKKSNV